MACIFVGVCCAAISAQTPAIESAAPLSSVPVTKLAEDLSADDFQQRRIAFEELWRRGSEVLPELKKAVQSDDKQMTDAVQLLEIMSRLGIKPEARDELRELLELGRDSELQLLKYLGRKEHWELAAEFAVQAGKVPRHEPEEMLYLTLSELVETATEQGNVDIAWPVIAPLLSVEERAWIGVRCDLESPDPDNVDEKALRLFFAGKTDEALELPLSPRRKFQLALWGGRWHILQERNMREMLAGTVRDTLEDRAVQAALQTMLNPQKLDDEALGNVLTELNNRESTRGSGNPDDVEQQTSRLFMSLTLAGEGEAAAEVLAKAPNREDLDLFWVRSDYARALKLYGLEEDGKDFDKWLPKASQNVGSVVRNGGLNGLETYRQYAEFASFLLSIGMVDEGSSLLESLIFQARNTTYQAYCMRAIAQQGSHAHVRPVLIKLLAKHSGALKPESINLILSLMYRDWSSAIAVLWETASHEKDPANRSYDSRWQMLETLWRLDRDELESDLGRGAVEHWLRRTLQEGLARESVQDERAISGAFFSHLSDIAKRLGYLDLALEIALMGSSLTNEADAATIQFELGDLQSAAELWARARSARPDHHDWIRKEIESRAITGDVNDLPQLAKSLWMRPLATFMSGTTNSYMNLAEQLEEEHDTETAVLYGRAAWYLADAAGWEGWFAGHTLGQIFAEDKKFAAAADVRRSANLALLAQPLDRRLWPSFLSRVALDYHDRALAHIQVGEFELAIQAVRRAEKLKPFSIELIEDTYPMLVEAGRQADADMLFDSFDQRMKEHLAKWPNDSTSHNNLAWMYARCGLKLEEAHGLAEKAVDLSDGSPTYMDTLAEVEFRLGRIDRAVELAQKCIKADPRHNHYREQLIRFRTEQLRTLQAP
ncbi:MAG: hypothetical protein U0892_00900 [Pirellulales bacterium]